MVAGLVHDHVVDRALDWRNADLDALALAHAPEPADGVFGVVVQDDCGAIVAMTSSAEDILGLTFEQMTGRTSASQRWMMVDEALHPLDIEQHPAMRVLASGRSVHDVVLGVHRPHTDRVGKHVWVSVTAVPIRRQAEGPLCVLSVLSVLTGARADRLRLGEAEANFRFIADNSSDMVAWQHVDTTYLWVSPASMALLGRSPEEMIGLRSIDLVHPEDRSKSVELVRAVASGVMHTSIVRRLLHADGHYVWVETTLHIAENEMAGATQVQTSSRDVDDRVAAQKAQADAEVSRDSAVRLFRTAMEHAAIGMAIRDVDGVIVEINGALCAMLGYGVGDLRGSTLEGCTHPDDLHLVSEARDALLSGRVVSHNGERRYLRSDGAVLWVEATSVLLPKEDREPQLVLTQMQDITARKDAIDQLTLLAVTDSLTGLANRAVLTDRLAVALIAAQRGGGDAGVVFVDLDGFKAVNDDLGHDIGDELLRQVAGRLSAAIRPGDTAARIGGDEFVVLCEQIDDPRQVRNVADRISRRLRDHFVIDGHQVQISASVGVAVGNGSSARAVLGRADEAMYRAKRRGRGLVDVHS